MSMPIRRTRVSFALSVDDSGIGWEDTKLSDEELTASVNEYVKRLLTDQIDGWDPHTGVSVKRLSNVHVELSESDRTS